MQERTDFSLVAGGPLFQLFKRLHLCDDSLDLVGRRILAVCAFTWLPLLILSVVEGRASGGVRIPFLYDIHTHTRFLLALPLFLYAERVLHLRMQQTVQRFLERGLIPEEQREKFFAAVESMRKMRDSLIPEILLVVFVYAVGVNVISRSVAANVPTWYAGGAGSRVGLWYVLVSLPFFQFIGFRWYVRLILWTRFLWQVSRLDLRLIPTHPDLSGGIGFLSAACYGFMPFLLAQGVIISGTVANWIFFEGGKLMQYRLVIVTVAAVSVFLVLGPLLVFFGRLSKARRIGLGEYGTLAQRYVREFDSKWVRGQAPEGEAFIGTADIQSLADLGNSYDIIKDMRVVPFSREMILQLCIVTLLPVLPLMLTLFSVEELVDRLLKAVF